MKNKTSWLLFILAGISVMVGIILGFIFQAENGPNPIWIQAGAAVSLIFITWHYVALTNKTLAEAEIARLQSFVPLLILRSREYKHDSNAQIAETYLLNAGEGVAVRIRHSTSILFPLNHDFTSDNPDLHPRVTNCFQGRIEHSNDALNPSHGNIESRITILEENLDYNREHALSNGVFGAIVVYDDKLGRGYCTLYIGNRHYFCELYSSTETSKKKSDIRRILLTSVGATIDVAMLVRTHGAKFWKLIIAQYNDRNARRIRK